MGPGAASAQPVAQVAQSAVVSFDSLDGTALNAWWMRPQQAPRGAVLLLHGCGGLYATRGPHQGQLGARHQAMADMLVADGYAVLLTDSFTPRGESELCTQAPGQRRITQRERRADALAAVQWLANRLGPDAPRIALLGWSHGGSAVLAAIDADHPQVQALAVRPVLAVAFYPGCGAAVRAGWRPSTPLLLLLGEKDDWTPPGPCIELAESVGAEAHVFPDAWHDFDNPSGRVRLRTDVPGGVRPGHGVHTGPNPVARAQAYAIVRERLNQAMR